MEDVVNRLNQPENVEKSAELANVPMPDWLYEGVTGYHIGSQFRFKKSIAR